MSAQLRGNYPGPAAAPLGEHVQNAADPREIQGILPGAQANLALQNSPRPTTLTPEPTPSMVRTTRATDTPAETHNAWSACFSVMSEHHVSQTTHTLHACRREPWAGKGRRRTSSLLTLLLYKPTHQPGPTTEQPAKSEPRKEPGARAALPQSSRQGCSGVSAVFEVGSQTNTELWEWIDHH